MIEVTILPVDGIQLINVREHAFQSVYYSQGRD